MSDLQIVLIVIGALIILVVVVINWWQERRFHKQVEKSFSSMQADALLDDPSIDTDEVAGLSQYSPPNHFAFPNTYPGAKLNAQTPRFDDINTESSAVVNTYNDVPHRLQEPSSAQEDNYNSKLDTVSISESKVSTATLPDNVSIDEAFTQLSKVISKPREDFNDYDLTKKPAQHDDIKAIFNEAFSNNNQLSTFQTPTIIEVDAVSKIEDIKLSTKLSVPSVLHSQVDLTALIYLAAETEIDTLRAAFHGLCNGYDKLVMVHVLTTNNEWVMLFDKDNREQVKDENVVSRVACSLQLADRSGAVSRQTLNRFQLAVESIGLDINAHVEWQSTGDALAAATMLDTFCIEVDKTIGFHLVHGENGAFTGTKLRGLAEAQGFSLDKDGTFKYLDENAKSGTQDKFKSINQEALFVIFNRDDYPFSPDMLRTSVVKSITFQLDIPHVKHCAEAFTQMVKVAKQMEVGLNAVLVDDNNKILGDIQIEKIRQQLKVIHATMLVKGIIPGSETAHRLFS